MVRGSPSMCMTTTPQPLSAHTSANSGSCRNPLTSFTMSAPAHNAARATAAFDVSMDMSPSHSPRNAATTGCVRAISCSTATGSAPGRVDSPPMSISSAPSAMRWRACASAAANSTCRPPSENESGVTFNIPITRARRDKSRAILRVFQIIVKMTPCRRRRPHVFSPP